MKRALSIAAGLAAGVLAALPVTALRGDTQPQDAGTRIATVNIGALFRNRQIHPVDSSRQELDVFVTERQGRLDTLQHQVEELRTAVEAAPEGSTLREDRLSELRQRTAEYQVYSQVYQSEINLKAAQLNIALYDRIRTAIGEVAQGRYEIVLRSDEVETDESERPGIEELLRRMRDRVVLYSGNTVDISPAVTDRLNQQP